MYNREIWSGIALIIVSILGVWGSLGLPETPTSPVSSSLFPIVLFGGLALCGIGLLIREKRQQEKKSLPNIKWVLLIPICLMILIYPYLIEWIGFLISSILFLVFMMFLLGERKWKNFVMFSIGAPVCIYLCFTQLFQIMLP